MNGVSVSDWKFPLVIEVIQRARYAVSFGGLIVAVTMVGCESSAVRLLRVSASTSTCGASGDVDTRELVTSVDRLMRHADKVRRLGVRANADTPDDARHAIHRGAEGVGLCRTEHMFLGERKQFVQNLILAASDEEREHALAALLPLQKGDFVQMFETMNGKPMVVRLIDPPLHEFLPDLTEMSVKVAVDRANGVLDPADEQLLAVVRRNHEANPMLGLRGVRLLLTMPGLIELQVRAIAEVATAVTKGDLTRSIQAEARGEVTYALWDPQPEAGDDRPSTLTEAARISARLIAAGRQVLTFTTSRVGAEVTARVVADQLELTGAGRGTGAEGRARDAGALEVAAAGGHHLIMVGPPGTGKTYRVVDEALAVLDRAHEFRRLQQGVVGAGVEPGVAPTHPLH